MKAFFLLFTFIPLSLILPHCNQSQAPQHSDSLNNRQTPLKETHWTLIEVNNQPVKSDGGLMKEPFLVFRETENRVVGNGSCNSISGTYELKDGNGISISNVISTKMACSNMETETRLLNALQSVNYYTISGDSLTLSNAAMDRLLKFTKREQQ